jgi:7,8-dihydropterin-6-yl-methyl-4-(beta-D-ribofuranosyl)aminobenzene 5'-phosphate synthase
LLVDEGPAKRPPPALSAHPSVQARVLDGGQTADLLRAEHGFSCAGLTPDGLVENMRRLGLSPHEIDIVVLTHGRWDHTTGAAGGIPGT